MDRKGLLVKRREFMFANVLSGLSLPLDTSPLPGAFFGAGAENTLIGGPRPERQADFFVPSPLPFPLSAYSCRACDEYKTLRGNQSAVPMTVFSARHQFLVSFHRLKIDHRSSR